MVVTDDRKISPYTGWTREHWDVLHGNMVRALFRYASPRRALIHFPVERTSFFGKRSDGMEGFTRSFMFNGPYLYHSEDGVLHFQGESYPLAEFYYQGLVAGTDRKSPEYWSGIKHRFQTIVESAGLSINLFFSKKLIWDNLSQREKQNVADYLYRVGRCRPYENNWLTMTAIIHATLKRFGMRFDEKRMMDCVESTDRLYIGDGAYKDGKRGCFDLYNPFVFHPYLLLWCFINPDTPESLTVKFKDRTRKFLKHYKHFFTADGSFVPFGRTLACRSAAVGIFPLAEFFNCSPLSQGQARRICSGNLKYFSDRGAFHDEGFVQLGYHSTLAPLAEFYSGPQSPLWMGIAWWAYLFPPHHPFWNVAEEPLEIEKTDYVRILPKAGFILSGKKKSGHIVLSGNVTHRVIRKKYSQMYFSTHFGMEVKKVNNSYCYDNCLAEKVGSSRYVLRRTDLSLLAMHDRFFALSYHLGYRFPLNRVTTYLLFKDNFVVRIHRIDLHRLTTLVEGGPALGFDEETPSCQHGKDWTYGQTEGKTLFLKNLHGWDNIYGPEAWDMNGQGSNLLHPFSVIPSLMKKLVEKKPYLLISACASEPVPLSLASLHAALPHVVVLDDSVTLTFQDGEKIFLQTGMLKQLDIFMNDMEIKGPVFYARIPVDGLGGVVLYEKDLNQNRKTRRSELLRAWIYRYIAPLYFKDTL